MVKKRKKVISTALVIPMLVSLWVTPLTVNGENENLYQSSDVRMASGNNILDSKQRITSITESISNEVDRNLPVKSVEKEVYQTNTPLTIQQSPIPTKGIEAKAKRFIVKYKSTLDKKKLNSTVKDGIEKSRQLKNPKNSNMEVITTTKEMSGAEVLAKIKGNNQDLEIIYIQPDIELTLASDDPYFSKQWALKNETVTGVVYSSLQTYSIDANVVPAWEKSQGEDTIVAVIDTAISIDHEDLKENIWINKGEIPGNGVDDDNNNYIDDIEGWNFYDDTNDVTVPQGAINEDHGTHISGTIAAVKNNNKGIAGVSPKSKIMPLKVFSNAKAFTSDIIEAIEYAEKMGATVVNASWGTTEDNPALKEAIEGSNMIFIAAAGNYGMNIDQNPVYPASYKLDNVITVASINKNGFLSSTSDYGENTVDVAAPGEEIISTLPGNRYGYKSGTSIAAAFVSGEAALLKSKFGNVGASNIKEKVKLSSDRLSSLVSKVSRGNKINYSNAINGLINDSVYSIDNYATVTNSVYQSVYMSELNLFSAIDGIRCMY